MMVHPGPGYTLYTAGSAMESVKISYKGKNAHAAGNPWEGVNALNAVIQACVGPCLATPTLSV